MIDSDDKDVLNLEFHYEIFHVLGLTIELVLGSSTSVTRLNLFFGYFLDSLKEPAEQE